MQVAFFFDPDEAASAAEGANVLVVEAGSGLERSLCRALAIPAEDHPRALGLTVRSHVVLADSQLKVATQAGRLAAACAMNEVQVEAELRKGFDLRARGDLVGAECAYATALEALGDERGPRSALVLVTLAEITESLGRMSEAVRYLDQALIVAPNHLGALRARAGLAKCAGENAVSAAMLHRLVLSEELPEARYEGLLAEANDSLSAARDALSGAARIRPNEITLLLRLKAVHEAAGDFEAAVGVSVQIAEATGSRSERARALTAAARLCSERTGNTLRAVALYEAAIEDDPTVPGAFEAIEAELLRSEDAKGLAAAYHRQIERLTAIEERAAKVRLWSKLSELQASRLADPEAAATSLRELLCLDPENAGARVALSELLVAARREAEAIESIEWALQMLPTRADLYRMLFTLVASRNQDRAYTACAALVALGEADLDEQLVYAQYSPDAVLSPSRVFDDDLWHTLAPVGYTSALDRVMRTVEPAALDIWRGEHPDAANQRPNEKLRQKGSESTASAVRCVLWASHLLGVPEPIIYADATNARITISSLPTPEPTIVLGRHILSGRSIPELVFIAAHHATFTRPGYRVLMVFPEARELEAIVRAAIALVRPDLRAVPPEDVRGQTFVQGFDRALGPRERQDLEGAVEALLRTKSQLDLKLWSRGVEQMACRAALLASGDVAIAASALSLLPGFGGSARDRATALLPFSVSNAYARLRSTLGVAVGGAAS